ncbi:MAG: MBOAT family protein, partial [Bdellovibrionales bacterium]
LLDFYCGKKIYDATSDSRKKLFVLTSAGLNLGVLGVFKYYDFFIGSFNASLSYLGVQASLPLLHVILPLGISFYTFQSLCYSIDVYRGQLKPCRNLVDFLLYVSFFPQLVAGPIERAGHILPQVEQDRRVTWDGILTGVILFSFGFFKKVALGDNLARLVDPVYGDLSRASTADVALATFFFAFQIYADFSGYTDMARGLARTMGFSLTINFNSPYFSRSPVEFWERWHISLSRWFKDYLYYPLAMHYLRKSTNAVSRYKAHLVSMALIGFWHGAAFKYLIFGVYWGVAIGLYIRFRPSISRLNQITQTLLTFFVAYFGWVIFRIPKISDISLLFQNVDISPRILHFDNLFAFAIVMIGFLMLVDYIFYRYPNLKQKLAELDKFVLLYLVVIFGVLLWAISMASRPLENKEFIYFQF